MSAQKEIVECPICMDPVNTTINSCITPCGHAFCFKCLALALAENNTCPCCRAELMVQPDVEDDDDEWRTIISDEEDEEDDDVFNDEAMTSFRMLFQRTYGEEVEPEPEEGYEEASDEEDEDGPLAEVEDITAKLESRGITMLDLVAMLTDRKSTKIAKHTDRFINALDSILNNAITDCDNEAKEAAQCAQSTQVQHAESSKEIA
jgi:hypothetical protein